MAEKYLDQSGVIRLLSGINNFVNTARKSVSTKMFTTDSFINVELEPNSITRVDSLVDGDMNIAFKTNDKSYTTYTLTFAICPNTNLLFSNSIIWDKELEFTEFGIVTITFDTYDGGDTYYASYILYLFPKNRIVYYSTTDGNRIERTDENILYNGSIPQTQENGIVYDHAFLYTTPQTTIPDLSFSGNDTLKTLSISKDVVYVGYDAFANTALFNESTDGLINVDGWGVAYKGSISETSFTIPSEIKGVASRTFENQTNLEYVYVPDSVQYLCDSVFAECSNLKEIHFTSTNVAHITENTFNGIPEDCKIFVDKYSYFKIKAQNYWNSLNLYAEGVNNNEILYTSTDQTLITPSMSNNIVDNTYYDGVAIATFEDNLNMIDHYAFADVLNLENIYLPESVKIVGVKAFSGCTSLQSVGLTQVKSISTEAFYECSALGTISIPKDTQCIGNFTFDGCTNAIIKGGNNVEFIGDDAFRNTKFYEDLAEGHIYIGKTYYCYKGTMGANTALTINDNTTSISYNAFANQANLISIVIPSSVKQISSSAFSGCSALTSITIGNRLMDISNYDGISQANVTYGDVFNSDFTSIYSYYYDGVTYGKSMVMKYVYNSGLKNYLEFVHAQGSGTISQPIMIDDIVYNTNFIYDSGKQCYRFESVDENNMIEILNSGNIVVFNNI